MKRSSGPRKTTNLSESIHQHLNMYAIAAGAAGVGVLALAQPVEAKIVYTTANVTIGKYGLHSYHLDFNHDGITDLTIQWFEKNVRCFTGYGLSERIDETPALRNLVEGNPPAELSFGANIGSVDRFYGRQGLMLRLVFGTRCNSGSGGWTKSGNHYLGVKFKIHRKTHFGWVRMALFVGPCGLCGQLTGYAYETIPGKSIIAGQTKGTDDSINEDFGPGAYLTSPTPDEPQPASLGMLALGAQGVPLWRRKESALEGELKGALL